MKQSNYILRKNCPSCGSTESKVFLAAPDFRVSMDLFSIHECLECGLHYTKDVPCQNDIAAFYKADSYDSHRLDNASFISRLYRFIRTLNIRRKVKWISRYSKNGPVVDYGCGLGHLVAELKLANFQVQGFEIDAEVRNLARESLGVNIFPLDEFKHVEANSISVLTMWHVLEHVYDLNSDFQQIVDKVAQDGVLFIAVPNFRSFDAKFYKQYWEAFDLPRHLYHFDNKSIESFCSRFGLNLESKIPLRFDSYYVSMRSEKNRRFGFLFRGIFVGWLSNLLAFRYGYSSHAYVFRKS